MSVRSSDGEHAAEQSFSVRVGNVNEAPVILSNGGGDTAAIYFGLKTKTAVTIAHGSDPDGTGIGAGSFSISRGRLRIVLDPDS